MHDDVKGTPVIERFRRPRKAIDVEHSIVYRNDDEFCGMPFLFGLWKTSDSSLLASFRRASVNYNNADDIHHDNLMVARGNVVSLRSTDNGSTWDPETMNEVIDLSTSPDQITCGGPADYSPEGPVDFQDEDVLVASGGVPAIFVPNARPWIRISTDGGRAWRRPILLPMTGLSSLSGQGSAVVRADGMCLVALTSVTPDGWTRRPLVYASPDGVHWNFLSFMTPISDDGQAVSEKAGSPRFGAHRYFYPRPLALRSGRLIATVRCQRDPTSVLWTELFESMDGGRTWQFLSRVNDWGAPGDICELSDGRIVCVYGYRLPPYGIRYRVSDDGGRTWGSELILRDDGGSWDLGYPRVFEVDPGRCLAIYYFNRKDDPIQMNGGVRHIAQSVFTPE
ncbi:sialidase family protein [Jiangella asiatica]|uniref:Exo-alpha-sialidase n=1 Tax=Jiangella asiatica TaxID=2530372 RepID=A0A4V2Z2V1_9ACTN|nr:sialidase family protein [Jiangella asiatica]TDE10178.1 exo-alpha-sialidase [Jiangella asiatica]